MRTALSALAASKSPVAQWLFACNGRYWTNGDEVTVGGHVYASVVKDFDGIDDQAMDPVSNRIPRSETTVSIMGSKISYDREVMVGQDCLVSLYDGTSVVYSWGYLVKNMTYHMGIWTVPLIDFLSPHLEKDYPSGPLVGSLEKTKNVSYAGDAQACIPEIFGRAYIPVRGAFVTDGRYHFIGPGGDAYTIYGAMTPVEWDQQSAYDAGEFTFNQSSVGGYAAMQAMIAPSGNVGNFYRAGQNYDMPLDYERASTVDMTSPADIMANVMQGYVPSAQIDLTGTWATAKATYAAISGLEFNVGFNAKQALKKVLCQLCTACNSMFTRSDKIGLVYRDDVAVRNFTRSSLRDFNFSEIENDTTYDGTSVGYYPDVQGGDPTTITVPVDGVSSSNSDSDTLVVIGLTDTVLIQKIGIRHAREKYLKIGTVSFSGPFSLDIEPGDKVSVSGDDLYQDFLHCYVERVKIGRDLSVSITAGVYSGALGDLDTFSPISVTPDEDDSLKMRPLSEKWLRTLFIRSATEPGLPVDENPEGWSESQPDGTNPLYMIQAWFGPDDYFWPGSTWMGVNRVGGIDGAPGVNGSRTASIELYKWSASTPVVFPAGDSTYTWATGVFTDPATLNGWAQNAGAGVAGQSLYSVRVVYADSNTTATSVITWPGSPQPYIVGVYGENGDPGEPGAQGDPGANGTRTAVLEVYKWDSSTPATFPSGTSTYTWATGAFTAPTTGNGWSISPGASTPGYKLYACRQVYSDTGTSAQSVVTWSATTSNEISYAGTNGATGATGATGPGLNLWGVYDSGRQYIKTASQRDVVISGSTFYAAVQSSLGQPVTDPLYWEALPSFACFATGFSLTDDALFTKTATVGWSDIDGHLADCSLRSGMTDKDTGNGFFFGRVGGDGVASIQLGGSYFKMDQGAGTFKIGGTGIEIDFAAATMTIGADAGLVVNSGGGITVNGATGIIVANGGDMTVQGGGAVKLISATNDAALKFFGSLTDTTPVKIYATDIGGASYQLNFISGDTGGKYFKVGSSSDLWKSIDMLASDLVSASCGHSSLFVDPEYAQIQSMYASEGCGVLLHSSATNKDIEIYGTAALSVDMGSEIVMGSDNEIDLIAPTVGINASTLFTLDTGLFLYKMVDRAVPTTSDIPDGYMTFYYDTTYLRPFIAYNKSGTIYYYSLFS